MTEQKPISDVEFQAILERNRMNLIRIVADALLDKNGVCRECLWEKPSCVCGKDR